MKSLRLYTLIISALLIIYLIAQYNRPNAVNWTASFSSEDKIPFGTYVLYHRLNDIFPKATITSYREPVYNVLNDPQLIHGTYIIIGDDADLNKYDYEKLLKFIKNGNDVFISASYFGEELKKQLKIETSIAMQLKQSAIGIRFVNKALDTNKVYNIGKGIGSTYFYRVDTAKCLVLGTDINYNANFIKYPMGKGNLLLNTNPKMFTNFSLFNNSGNEYAATALSFVKNDSNLIWDQYYALGKEDEGSSMRVFLRNTTLRWAFYISFFSLILFVLYEKKRRQRIIPVIEPLENSTLGFVSVVGQVYYEQRNNQNISGKKIQYFLDHLRTKYNLKTQALDQAFLDNFIQKTGTEASLAKDLIECINALTAKQIVTNKDLVKLNQLIEKFYIQS